MRHHTLDFCAFADDIAESIGSAKLVSQLETLTFSRCDLGDDTIGALHEQRARLSHLRELRLDHDTVGDWPHDN